ncbi:MAG: hypothetical protein PHD20_02425 [Clostridia bacterium]|nr:hypothetical protein [Clostridia bacterium]
MKTKQKKGISLIVLVITIIVMIILAGTIILSLTGSGVIGKADEGVLKSDLKSFEGELMLYKSKEMLKNNKGEINIAANEEEIYKVLPSLKGSKYDGIIQIENGKIVIIASDVQIAERYNNLGYNIADKRAYEQGAYYSLIKNVNTPVLLEGMAPIKWTGQGESGFEITQSYDENWYNYTDTSSSSHTSKWANAQTEDGSMWVWIPRFAYKINYTNPSNKGAGGTIDILFLKGNSNKYIDSSGNEKQIPTGYLVHPAFQDESQINFKNGGWDKEIPGFWIAKFEAGFEENSPKSTGIKYNNLYGWNKHNYVEELGGWIYWYNIYGQITNSAMLKYPVFRANQIAYNYVTIGDCYESAKSMIFEGNPYGLKSDSYPHITKNSEWGAVVYLTHSKYGVNGNKVEGNNSSTFFTVMEGQDPTTASRYVITAGGDNTTENKKGLNSKTVLTKNKLQSTTGNEYGIYDMSGGLSEFTAGYFRNSDLTEINTGNKFWSDDLKKSTKYKSYYYFNSGMVEGNRYYNLPENSSRKGEAIWETSTGGSSSYLSWHDGATTFMTYGFTLRGGAKNSAGSIFGFSYGQGTPSKSRGWRPCLIRN